MSVPFVIKTSESKYYDHHLYFFQFPQDGAEMVEVLSLFNSAIPGVDTIHIHMNNSGGELATGLQLLFAIEEAIVHGVQVVMYLESLCESMAAVFVMRLILLGVELHYGEGFYLMFHNVSINGGEGTCTNVLHDAAATQAIYKNMLIKSCKPMMTDEEIQSILDGKELYIFAGDLTERIKNIVPVQETLH